MNTASTPSISRMRWFSLTFACTPPETATDAKGFATLTFRTTSGFPLGPKQRSVQIFVRARKLGEDLLTGISARRLFAIPIAR